MQLIQLLQILFIRFVLLYSIRQVKFLPLIIAAARSATLLSALIHLTFAKAFAWSVLLNSVSQYFQYISIFLISILDLSQLAFP